MSDTWYPEYHGQKTVKEILSFKFIDILDGYCSLSFRGFGHSPAYQCELNFNNRTATAPLSNMDYDMIECEIVKRIIRE